MLDGVNFDLSQMARWDPMDNPRIGCSTAQPVRLSRMATLKWLGLGSTTDVLGLTNSWSDHFTNIIYAEPDRAIESIHTISAVGKFKSSMKSSIFWPISTRVEKPEPSVKVDSEPYWIFPGSRTCFSI